MADQFVGIGIFFFVAGILALRGWLNLRESMAKYQSATSLSKYYYLSLIVVSAILLVGSCSFLLFAIIYMLISLPELARYDEALLILHSP
jgi:hypothetical protein